MPSALATWIAVLPVLLLAPRSSDMTLVAPPERVQLTLATLHAAELTTARAAGDTTDSPMIVMSVAQAGARAASILALNGPASILRNGAFGAQPIRELSLAAGDSVEMLMSVLERTATSAPGETNVPLLIKQGALEMGSVRLLLTNEGGAAYWRRLECVTACKVLTAPTSGALPQAGTQVPGILEFTGSGGVYHLALRVNRAS